MNKVLEYKIVTAVKAQQVAKRVDELLQTGWQPLGPCQYNGTDNTSWYVQTMVKYESNSQS